MRQIIVYLIYAFVFLLPFQTRWIFNSGIINGGYFEYGTMSVYAAEIILGLIILLSIIFVSLKIKKGNFKLDKREAVGLLILASTSALLLINCLAAINKEIAFNKAVYLIMAAAFIGAIWITKPDFKKMSWCVVLSGCLQAILAICQFAEQKVFASKWLGMAAQSPQTLGVPVIEFSGGRWLRAFGSLPHPNILAGFLLISLILCLGLLIAENAKSKKWLNLIFVIIFVGLIASFSRAAFISFIAVIILLAYFFRNDKIAGRTVAKYAVICAFIILIFSISYPELVASRAMSNGRVEKISNTTRLEQLIEAKKIIQNNWLIGTGIGNYTLALVKMNPNLQAWQYQPVHNSYLLIIAEMGLAGIAFVIGIILMLWRRLKTINVDNPLDAIALTAAIGLLLLALFDHFMWSFYFGIMLSALICGLNVSAEKK